MNSPCRALSRVLCLAVFALPLGLAAIAHGGQAPDTITLKNGAVLEGKIMGRAPGLIVFKSIDGKLHKLADADVKSVRSEGKLRAEYGRRAGKLKRTDYAGHLALAKWCLDNALSKCGATEVSSACDAEAAADLRAAARMALRIQRLDLAKKAADKGAQTAPDDPFLQAVAQSLGYLNELKDALGKAKQALEAARKQLAEHQGAVARLEKLIDAPVEVVEREVDMRCRSCGGTGKSGGSLQARATIQGLPVQVNARLDCRSCMGLGVQRKKANVAIVYARSAVEQDLAWARQTVNADAVYAAKLEKIVDGIERVAKRVVVDVLAETPKAPEREMALLSLPAYVKPAPASPTASAKGQQPANPATALAAALQHRDLDAAYAAAKSIGEAASEGSTAQKVLAHYYVVRKLAKAQGRANRAIADQSRRIAECEAQLARTTFMLTHQDKKCVWLRVRTCPACRGRGTVSAGWAVSVSSVRDPNAYSRPLPRQYARMSSGRRSRRLRLPTGTTRRPKQQTCPRCRGSKTVQFWELPTAKTLEAERAKLMPQLPSERAYLAKLEAHLDEVRAMAAAACSALTDAAAQMPAPAEVVGIELPIR